MLKQIWMLLWWRLETLELHPGCGVPIKLRTAAKLPKKPGVDNAGDNRIKSTIFGYSGAPLQTKAPAQ